MKTDADLADGRITWRSSSGVRSTALATESSEVLSGGKTIPRVWMSQISISTARLLVASRLSAILVCLQLMDKISRKRNWGSRSFQSGIKEREKLKVSRG